VIAQEHRPSESHAFCSLLPQHRGEKLLGRSVSTEICLQDYIFVCLLPGGAERALNPEPLNNDIFVASPQGGELLGGVYKHSVKQAKLLGSSVLPELVHNSVLCLLPHSLIQNSGLTPRLKSLLLLGTSPEKWGKGFVEQLRTCPVHRMQSSLHLTAAPNTQEGKFLW
jgi:hypothetical protein